MDCNSVVVVGWRVIVEGGIVIVVVSTDAVGTAVEVTGAGTRSIIVVGTDEAAVGEIGAGARSMNRGDLVVMIVFDGGSATKDKLCAGWRVM